MNGYVVRAGKGVDFVADRSLECMIVAVVVKHIGDAGALLIEQRCIAEHAGLEMRLGDTEENEAVDGRMVGGVGNRTDLIGRTRMNGVVHFDLARIGLGTDRGADCSTEIALIFECEGYCILRVDSLLRTVDDRRFTDALPKAVRGFSGVSAGDTIKAEWHFEEVEPFRVGLLAHIEVVGRCINITAVTAELDGGKQLVVLSKEFLRRTGGENQYSDDESY